MIRINEDYVIDSDEISYVLKLDKHKLNSRGKPLYINIGYYTSLESALIGAKSTLIHKYIGENDYSLDEAVRMVREVSNEFIEKFREVAQGDKV